MIALVSAVRCTRQETLVEQGIILEVPRPQVVLRAHNCAPEVRSYVYGQLDGRRCGVVPAQGIEVEIGVVVQIDELTAPPPARCCYEQPGSLEAGDALEPVDVVSEQGVPTSRARQDRIDPVQAVR